VPNTFIHAKVRVQEGYLNKNTGNRSQPRINFLHMELLHDILDNNSKGITFQIPLKRLNDEVIEGFNNLLESNSGDKMVQFLIYDRKERIKLRMKTRNKKVSISKKLIEELELLDFKYKVN